MFYHGDQTQRKIALKKMDKDATDQKAPGQATETFIDQSKEPKVSLSLFSFLVFMTIFECVWMR